MAQFIAHSRVDDIDRWFFLHYGRELLEGATLYADLWDIKPPGIFWINALGLWSAGGSQVGVWIVCAIASCASVALFYVAARQVYSPACAAIGAILAAVFLNFWTFHTGGDRPATFLILTEVACMTLYLKAMAHTPKSKSLLFWAGVLGGGGLWFKQTAFAASAAIVLHILIARRDRSVDGPRRRSQLILFATGFTASLGTMILALVLTSDLAWAWDAIVAFNFNYFTPGVATSFFPSTRWMVPHARGMDLALILAAATLIKPAINIIHKVTGRSNADDTASHTHSPSVLLLYWMWMLIAIYLSAIGPHNRPMYLAVALPPLVMLATHSVHLLLNSAKNRTADVPVHYVVVGLVWFAYMLWTPLNMQFDFALQQYHWSNQPPDARLTTMVDAIERHSQPGEAMFACGYAPELYWRANRRQAIRYHGTEKAEHLHQHGQPLLDETTRSLQAAKPKIIILQPNRFHQTETQPKPDATELVKWIKASYHQPEPEALPSLWVRNHNPS